MKTTVDIVEYIVEDYVDTLIVGEASCIGATATNIATGMILRGEY